MDKSEAINIAKRYIDTVGKKYVIENAILYGSFAKGTNHKDSDIDLAIVLAGNNNSFDIEVKLMTLRKGEETLIEPHPFNKDEFKLDSPIVYQIVHSGQKLIF